MSLLKDIGRLEVKSMETWELDAGFGLAIGLPVRKVFIGGEPFAEALRNGVWRTFSPTGSWDDFGYAVELLGGGLVMSVHRDTEENTVRYYSAHAFISGTSFDTRDGLRIAAAKAAVSYGKLMDWEMAVEAPPEAEQEPAP